MSDLSITADTVHAENGPLIIVAAGRQATERASEPHMHPRGQLMASLGGLLSVRVDGAAWVVPSIHAVWFPPHQLHAARSHGPFAGWAAYIDEAACADLPARPCTIRTSSLLTEAVLRAATWPVGPLDAQQERIAAVILDEIRSLPVEPFGLPLPADRRLQNIAQALIADPADERDLEQWATWAAIGSRTLSRRFVAETGFTFTAWRQRARLMRSLEMLAAGVPVANVALDLGYASASAFIALFRRTFGSTPASYQRQRGS